MHAMALNTKKAINFCSFFKVSNNNFYFDYQRCGNCQSCDYLLNNNCPINYYGKAQIV